MFDATLRIALLLVIALCLPNSLEILARHKPALGVKPEKLPRWLLRQSQWTESPSCAVGMATVAAAGILSLGRLSEFLYWQF
jgi:alginate O-acetyltransferase complex protein AlgI